MLPQKLDLAQTQVKWATQLDPLISNPLTQGQLLQDIRLINGTTVVNHKLGRKLTGWFVVGVNAPIIVYDSQATNQMQDLTLVLNSNAVATVNLWVF